MRKSENGTLFVCLIEPLQSATCAIEAGVNDAEIVWGYVFFGIIKQWAKRSCAASRLPDLASA
jgi:hypothetical protein